MHQLLQDTLAIGREFCKVNVFMKVTCNADWPEIVHELSHMQTASDHANLTAHMFQLKKQAILDDILKNGVLRHTVVFVYTIEFQKRDLSHMHILIFFANEHKSSVSS